jgi:RNA recognition motif-containing protein
MDRETGRSKGFGFVEMGSDAEAQAAINGMNGQALEGRAIVVNEARPREERPGGFGGGGGGWWLRRRRWRLRRRWWRRLRWWWRRWRWWRWWPQPLRRRWRRWSQPLRWRWRRRRWPQRWWWWRRRRRRRRRLRPRRLLIPPRAAFAGPVSPRPLRRGLCRFRRSRGRAAWIIRLPCVRRGLRPRPATAVEQALGSRRISLATTPICQGMTR